MALSLMGKKLGMSHVFDAKGNLVVVTLVEIAQPNVVTQVKTKETDGYEAIQLGFDVIQAKDPRRLAIRTKKPQFGTFQKNGIAPRRHLKESSNVDISNYSVGQELGVEQFEEGQYVDVSGVSKGKGFQGVMKRHNFAGGPASHGASRCHRLAGSTGMRSTPGRNLPGGKKAGHMGSENVTVQSLLVVKVVPEDRVIAIKGAIPGPRNALVHVTSAVKKRRKQKAG
jgi:large subunit ribosomal protein L3